MKKVAVNIEWRRPVSKLEKKCYGVTTTRNPAIIDVFLRSNTTGERSVQTFFHEMTHVFFRCYDKHKKLPKGFEEHVAGVIGSVAAKILGA
jgi:hypothetical protein